MSLLAFTGPSLAVALVACSGKSTMPTSYSDPNACTPTYCPEDLGCEDGVVTSCVFVDSENSSCPDVSFAEVSMMRCQYGCVKEGRLPLSPGAACNVAPDAGTGECGAWCDAGANDCNTCHDGVATTCEEPSVPNECGCAGPPKRLKESCTRGCDDAGIACISTDAG
jgi:hypothetical protein